MIWYSSPFVVISGIVKSCFIFNEKFSESLYKPITMKVKLSPKQVYTDVTFSSSYVEDVVTFHFFSIPFGSI